jgi:hypothetical protein
MSYFEKMADLADAIKRQVDLIRDLERERGEWLKPAEKRVKIGSTSYCVVSKDGTVDPRLVGWQREAIKAHDEAIFLAKGRLEGLRYRLIELGKKGGAT